MQGKWSKFKNFESEERKQSKTHCSPVKLERKKNDKKIIDHRGKATDHLVSLSLPLPHTHSRKQRNETQHSRIQGK